MRVLNLQTYTPIHCSTRWQRETDAVEKHNRTSPFRCMKFSARYIVSVHARSRALSHRAWRRWSPWPCGSRALADRHTPAARACWIRWSGGWAPLSWYRTWSPAPGAAGRVWCCSGWLWGCCQLNQPGWRAQAPPCSRGDGGIEAPERTRCTWRWRAWVMRAPDERAEERRCNRTLICVFIGQTLPQQISTNIIKASAKTK